MSASHRKIARLPSEVFDSLLVTQQQQQQQQHQHDPEVLRASICARLKRFPFKSRNATTTSTRSVKTVGDLLRTSKRTLLHALDPLLTYEEIERFLNRVYRECAPKPVSALDLWHATTADLSTSLPNNNNTIGEQMRYLPTGWPRLDNSVGGGIRVGTVTELVGRAGVGKTQLAMQLCLEAAKYNQATMYMDTEHKVSIERLREMSLERCLQEGELRRSNDDGEYHHNPAILMHHHDWNHHGSENIPPADMQDQPQQSPSTKQFHYKRPEDIYPNLLVRTPGTTSELLSSLESAEAQIWNRNQQPQHDDNSNTSGVTLFPIRLLIVDSIAAPMKRDFGSDSAPQRAAAVFQCAQTLKRLADQLHLAVVVINQVGLADSTRSDPPGGVSVRAALGTSWHHCVSTRLLMEHEVDLHHNHTGGGVVVNHHGGYIETTQPARRLSIVKSNVAAFSTMWFQVTKMGIVEATRQDEEMEEWTQ